MRSRRGRRGGAGLYRALRRPAGGPHAATRLIPGVLLAGALIAGVLLSGCAAGAPAGEESGAARTTAPRHGAEGHLVIVGGGPRPAAIMERFIELAGGPGQARIAVVPMSSSEAEETGRELVEEMLALGAADAINLLLTRAEANEEEAIRRLEGITGVWFAGGDQNRHTAALKDTPVEAALHQLYRDGAVLGGTSAGAAIMSAIMITGDEHRPGGERPSRESFITIDRENIVTAPGFGFLDNAIVDQHFVRRKRHNRLLSLVLEHPDLIGVGIDEATALVVQPDGTWQVIGKSAVVVYDPRGGQVTPSADPILGGVSLRLHLLTPGSTFDPATGEATLPVAGASRT